ncbi:Acyl-protein thioesterase 1 [Metarhizium anisopliae]|nr:Acyl-protein thioesterase 1 [Metarhizium anisopliae]
MVMLHGRGSNGQEFAQEFFSSHLSDNVFLKQKLSGLRWVFPSSQKLWSTAFQELIPAWFEAHSLTDITARQDLQIGGINDSVKYLQGLLENEIARLGGQAGNLFLGGISQGGAIGLWTLLCQGPACSIGAFLGASTWLPFASNLERIISLRGNMEEERPKATAEGDGFDAFVSSMMISLQQEVLPHSLCQGKPKIFLGHGVDDAYVDVTLGRQARDALSRAGFVVEWKEYSGAEEEGHWFQVPDEMDDMYRFIMDIMSQEGNSEG